MKFRNDFVTNSSSSSFILARKGELTEKEKEVIIEFVEAKLLGRKILTPDNTEEEIQQVIDDNYICEEDEEKIQKALKEGKSIYNGWVSFEDYEYNLSDMFVSLWNKLEEADGQNFEIIDGTLEY